MRTKLTVIAVFLVFSFIFISSSDYANAQGDFGCCRSVDAPNVPAGECVGCEGENCSVSGAYCTSVGGFITGGTCISQPEGAICEQLNFSAGCCAIAPGQCLEDTEFDDCIFVEEGILLAQGESCSVIELCEPLERNVPSLSQWGLIALAGVLGILGLIVIRRRATA